MGPTQIKRTRLCTQWRMIRTDLGGGHALLGVLHNVFDNLAGSRVVLEPLCDERIVLLLILLEQLTINDLTTDWSSYTHTTSNKQTNKQHTYARGVADVRESRAADALARCVHATHDWLMCLSKSRAETRVCVCSTNKTQHILEKWTSNTVFTPTHHNLTPHTHTNLAERKRQKEGHASQLFCENGHHPVQRLQGKRSSTARAVDRHVGLF